MLTDFDNSFTVGNSDKLSPPLKNLVALPCETWNVIKCICSSNSWWQRYAELLCKVCEWLTDLKKNTFYEFGTLFHCFNDCSLDYHIVRAQNVLLWLVRRCEDALSIKCTLLKAVPNVQQFLNFVNSWLIHALLDKAVNK